MLKMTNEYVFLSSENRQLRYYRRSIY